MKRAIDCLRKKSFMTPCVITDGKLAICDSGFCVGCGKHYKDIIEELREIIEDIRKKENE